MVAAAIIVIVVAVAVAVMMIVVIAVVVAIVLGWHGWVVEGVSKHTINPSPNYHIWKGTTSRASFKRRVCSGL